MTASRTEAWLRGPVPGVPGLLQPAAHALVEAREVAAEALAALDDDALWRSPGGGAASCGYHVLHAAGSLDRLFTYARGEQLDEAQRAALAAERDPRAPRLGGAPLRARLESQVERALAQLRATDPETLLEGRGVGRAALPSTVIGLLFHGAEHTTRHVGQLVTTAKIVAAAGKGGK